jgi:hypothetical protein
MSTHYNAQKQHMASCMYFDSQGLLLLLLLLLLLFIIYYVRDAAEKSHVSFANQLHFKHTYAQKTTPFSNPLKNLSIWFNPLKMERICFI